MALPNLNIPSRPVPLRLFKINYRFQLGVAILGFCLLLIKLLGSFADFEVIFILEFGFEGGVIGRTNRIVGSSTLPLPDQLLHRLRQALPTRFPTGPLNEFLRLALIGAAQEAGALFGGEGNN